MTIPTTSGRMAGAVKLHVETAPRSSAPDRSPIIVFCLAGCQYALCLVLISLLFLAGGRMARADSYTLDEWMSISRISAFEFSPDGQYLYYTSNAAASGTDDVFRIPAGGGRPQRLGVDTENTRPEPKEELTVSPDGKSLYFTAARYFESYLNIYRMPAEGGPAEPLTFNDALIQTSPAISPDGGTLAFFARTQSGMKIYTLDLNDRKAWPRLLMPGMGEEWDPTWSSDGTLAFRSKGDVWIKKRGARPERVIDSAYGAVNGDYVWSPDGRHVAFTNEQSGYSQIGVVEVASGAVTPLTYGPVEHDEPAWSPDGRWVVYLRRDESGLSNQVVITRADGSGGGRVVTRGKGMRSAPRFSPDGQRLAFIESTATRTADIWTADLDSGRLNQVTDSMGAIDPAALGQVREMSYRGEDNLEIPTMVWLPPGFDPSRKYPVLVRLHGHPGQWNHEFEMMTQYFVSRGFVAVAPNPRGSEGFGQGFHDLHIADYGGGEFRDVMNVLPFLDTLGYIDMNRKATWGGSGGGYLSLVIATEAPEAFEAQVLRAPVSSWKHLAIDRFGASGRAWAAKRTPARERGEFGGSYEEIPEEYERRSPVNFADNATVPQLLFHGLRDSAVSPRQSELWVNRMRALGKGELVHYVEYPDEDHGLNRYKVTVRDRIEKMTYFFAENLDMPELVVERSDRLGDEPDEMVISGR